MKEVNDIIDELHVMLKPRIMRIESEEKEQDYESIDDIIMKE